MSGAARASFSESAIVFLHVDDEGYQTNTSSPLIPASSSSTLPPSYSDVTKTDKKLEGKIEEKKGEDDNTTTDIGSAPPSIKKPRIVLNMADRVPSSDKRSRREILSENFHSFINHWSYYFMVWLSLVLLLFAGIGLYTSFGDDVLYAWGVYFIICFTVLFVSLVRGSIRLKQEKEREEKALKEAETQLKNNMDIKK